MLEPLQFKKLAKISHLRPLVDIALCWGAIWGAFYLFNYHPFFLPVSVVIITTRLHALIILMHDGAHYLLNKNSLLNDIVSNVFCSFPLQISTEAYRLTHHKHHQYTQTLDDPNYVIMKNVESWRFPKEKEEVKKLVIKDLFLLTIKDHLLVLKDWQVLPHYKKITKLEQCLFPLFMVSVLMSIVYFGLWKEFLVFQFSALLINPIVRIRAMSEHIHVEASGQGKIPKLHETTTINANWFERFIFSPLNTNRHLEHHLYPSIPYYNLEKVHKLIKQTELYKEHCDYELDGYLVGKKNSLDLVLSAETTPSLKGHKNAA